MRAEKGRKKNPPSEEQRGTRQATNIQSVPALIFCRYLAWQIARNGTSAAEERPAERDVSVSEEKKIELLCKLQKLEQWLKKRIAEKYN